MSTGDKIAIGQASIGGMKSNNGVISFTIVFNGDNFPNYQIGELAKLDRKGVFSRVTIEPQPRNEVQRLPLEDPAQTRFSMDGEGVVAETDKAPGLPEDKVDADFEIVEEDEPLAKTLETKPRRGRPSKKSLNEE